MNDKPPTVGPAPEEGRAEPAPTSGELGLVGLSRELVRQSIAHGATSITYHISVLFQSFTSTLPHLHFHGEKRFSRHNLPAEHAEVLGRCHEYLLKIGKPIILSKYLPAFEQVEPELTSTIMSEANKYGVFDQYMVPVFGPHNVNGVISFGYPQKLNWRRDAFLHGLEALAITHHTHSVRQFGNHSTDVELSTREREVLTWIAKGKSNAGIADILGISTSTVDTYARRLFEKMGVNDRISATVAGLRHRLISID